MKRCLYKEPDSRFSAHEAYLHAWMRTRGKDPLERDKIKKCLRFIKGFSGRSRLQLSTLKYITQKMLTQDESDELKDTFFAINVSFTGDLSRTEMLEAFWNNGYKEMDVYTLDGIFAQLDDDNSGLLSFSEFLVPSIDPMVSLNSNEKLWMAFKDMEINNKGYITMSEIEKVLSPN